MLRGRENMTSIWVFILCVGISDKTTKQQVGCPVTVPAPPRLGDLWQDGGAGKEKIIIKLQVLVETEPLIEHRTG